MCLRMQGRVYQQREDFDVNSSTAIRVHHHGDRSVLVSIVLVWCVDRFIWHIHHPFQYLAAPSASLNETVCMKVSIGSRASSDECNDGQIDTPWGYIKSHGEVTDGKSESPGARDQDHCVRNWLP